MTRDLHRNTALWLALAFCAIAVIAYLPGTRAGFYFDDEQNIVRARALHWEELSLSNLRAAVEDAALPRRPVANVSFALNHLVGGMKPAGYHWTNLLIHLGCGFALGWLCWLLALHGDPRGGERRWAAIVAVTVAGVFLVHPLGTQAVTYVVQRMTSLSAMFTLLALAAYVRARMRPARRVGFAAAALVCWALALGSKEIAVCAPLLVALYELCYRRDEWRDRLARTDRRALLAVAAGIAALAGLALWILSRELTLGAMIRRDFTGLERVLTQPRVHVLYLSLLLWPSPARLSLEHDIGASTGLLEPATTLPALIAIALAFAAAAWLVWRRPLFGFPIAGYLAAHILESLPVNIELVFEHRMYLPMALLLLGLGAALLALPRRRARAVLIATLLVSVALAAVTYQRNRVWSNGIRFMSDTAKKAPDKFRPWYNLGTAYLGRGEFGAAEGALLRAVAIDPTSSEAHNQLANIYRLTGRPDQALPEYRAAVEADADNAEAHYNLANLLRERGERDEAIHHFRRFIEVAPPRLHRSVKDARHKLRALGAPMDPDVRP